MDFTDYATRVTVALIVAGFTASYGHGYPFQSLYYFLAILNLPLDAQGFFNITLLHTSIIFVSGLARGAKD